MINGIEANIFLYFVFGALLFSSGLFLGFWVLVSVSVCGFCISRIVFILDFSFTLIASFALSNLPKTRKRRQTIATLKNVKLNK